MSEKQCPNDNVRTARDRYVEINKQTGVVSELVALIFMQNSFRKKCRVSKICEKISLFQTISLKSYREDQ